MKYIVAFLLASTAIASAQTQTDFKANTPISSSGVNSAFGSKLDLSGLGQANGPAKLNGNKSVNGLFDAMRSTPTGVQTPGSGQPGDNQALPSVNCTPVGQNASVSIQCYNMDAPAVSPSLPLGNNSRQGSALGAVTVNVGLENYGASNSVALYAGIEGHAGAGTSWALNSVTNILSGDQHGGAGYEMDVNNVSCDPGISGTSTCGSVYGAWITGLTGFTNSVGLLITKSPSGPGTNALWHLGVDVTSADIAAYEDTSSAVSSYQDGGAHSVGLHLGGTYSAAAITMSAPNAQNGLIHWDSIPAQGGGASTSFAFNPADSAIANGQKGATLAFGGQDGLQIDQSGDVMTQGYFNARGNLGAVSTGLPTQGGTLAYNLTAGGQETDLLIGGGTSNGSLEIYGVTPAGNLSSAKGAPLAQLSATGVFSANGIVSNGPVTAATTLKGGVQTVAGLSTTPCTAAARGTRYSVSDAVAPTFLGTLTGGGTVFAPVICNGTAWVAG